MDELVGPNLQIKLSIKEGKGFDKITYPTIIIATINGHSLETNVFETDTNPQYATDLVWEADKNAVRKMRSAQVPLKVECFMLKANGIKEKFGYLLLSVRSAQILTKSREASIKSTWNTLLGLKSDFKTCKPELLISLTIEDQENSNAISKSAYEFQYKHSNCICTISIYHVRIMAQLKEDLETNRSSLKEGIVPCLQRDERLIQLGPPEICQDIFLLSITAGMAANLDLLAKEQVGAETTFSFWYRILETDMQLRPFRSNDASSWILNEKIVIRIRSSLSALKNYLETKPFLLISLRHKDAVIGQTELDLRPLVPTENLQEFLRIGVNSSTILDQQCSFVSDSKIECEGHVRKPYVSLELKLQYAGTKNPSVSESRKTNLMPQYLPTSYTTPSSNDINFQDTTQNSNLFIQKHSEVESHRNPGGDFGKCRTGVPCVFTCGNVRKHSVSCETIQHRPTSMHPHSSEPVINCCNEYSKSVEAYHCYCLNVQLNGIKLNTSCPIIHHIEFRFHHPKAEIMSTLHSTMPILSGEKVRLQDIGCKLHFISAAEEIKKLLLSFPPKISICDAGKEEKLCMAQTILDMQRLLGHKFECQYEAALMDSDQRTIGFLDVVIHLEDHGPYYRTKKRISGENLGPPILDDSLAYKIVDELETWKERQKEIFRVELRKKEERHLNLLSAEWQMRKDNLEAKFACSVEQCKSLANSLNHATEDLRTRRLQSLEKEARLIKEKEDLQCKYNHMIQEIKETSYKMQEELSLKMKYLEDQNRVLEMQLEPLKRENERLQQIVNKQVEKLEIHEKGSLTQDQTASLLQELKSLEEKLNNAQKSKSFFKEQWGKAVREIHRMKMEKQQAVELQIKSNKEELKNLNVEDILNADTPGLPNDQILLGQLQKELNVLNPKPTFLAGNSNDQIFAPISNLALKSNRSAPKSELTTRSEEHEEKLRMLIEERNSLLKTGSYTIDDAVIIKLNNEIRSFLIFG